jgi:hypothetical protein
MAGLRSGDRIASSTANPVFAKEGLMPGAVTRWEPFAELGELRYGSFTRSMALPAGVDPKKIKAKTRDGVVEVTIPCPNPPKRRRSRSHRAQANPILA